MNKKRISGVKKLTGLMLFLFVSAGLYGQANFSGNWAYNESKSVVPEGGFGGGPMGGGPMTITQDAKTITSNTTMQGPDGEMKMTRVYNLDGTESENVMFMETKAKSTLTWSADKKSATIVTNMKFDMGGESREFKTTETWKLSDDGKTLFVESTMPAGPDGGEPRKTTRAYDKK
jgi:hypothetical protein